jgi:hypothetical protein
MIVNEPAATLWRGQIQSLLQQETLPELLDKISAHGKARTPQSTLAFACVC